jgi:flagellar hook-associated protein 2
MDLGVAGLASNFDWKSLVEQLVEVERQPQQRLLVEQNRLEQRNNAYGSIKTQLNVLLNRVQALTDGSLFNGRTTTVSNTSAATATAAAATPLGSYTFNVTQLATAAAQRGSANAGAALSATDDVSGVNLSTAGFSTAVSAGTFTVNGKQITIATTDTLQDVFDQIGTATGGDVVASYSSATDQISFTATSGEVILGSATDSSNFLQVARLQNNGTATATSSSAVGGVVTTGTLANSNLATAITDGGSGAGEFKINGVAIEFDSATDNLGNILQRINDSAAGVSASYDSVNDRFILTNKTTGDLGVALEDVTGNFLAATGLSSGTVTRGNNLLYTVNGGGQLSSQSNTITEGSSGLTGLSVTALEEGATFDVVVATDTATIKTAITDFIADYNKAQSVIDTQTASSTDSKGKVTAGLLANEREPFEISSALRRLAYNTNSGLTGVFKNLADIGITTNGNDNSLAFSAEGEAKLDTALANNLSAVSDLFTNASDGLAVDLETFLEATVGEEAGEEGTLIDRQDLLTKQAGGIDTEIENLERIVQQNRQRMIDSFIAMETVQQRVNQQLQFLQQQLGQSSASK